MPSAWWGHHEDQNVIYIIQTKIKKKEIHDYGFEVIKDKMDILLW
jgi:hypothetical protein